MSYLPSPSDGDDFTLPPAGAFSAICYRVIDIGTQASSFKGEEKLQHKVMLSWELKSDETIMEDGQPMSIHQRYTWSMFDNAILRKHLESWRGAKFTDKDFGPGGFNVRKLLGVACLLNIVHETKKDRTFANVSSIMSLPKGMAAGSLINTPVYLWLAPDGFDQGVFEALSDKLQETIKKSPEYQALTSGKASHSKSAAQRREEDDRIPF